MTYEDMQKTVKALIVDDLCCDEDAVIEKASLIEDLGCDELDVIELIMSLEEEFGITISEEECNKLLTVGDIYRLMVQEKVCSAPEKD